LMRGIVVPMIMWRIEVHRTPTLEKYDRVVTRIVGFGC
jgi:hypothetical protein